MWIIEYMLYVAFMVCLAIAGLFVNLFLIEEKNKIKLLNQDQSEMQFIKAKDLMPGDIFKVNPRLPKEHWADTVTNKFSHVTIVTWGRSTLSMHENDLVFLIRSTNPERNGKK